MNAAASSRQLLKPCQLVSPVRLALQLAASAANFSKGSSCRCNAFHTSSFPRSSDEVGRPIFIVVWNATKETTVAVRLKQQPHVCHLEDGEAYTYRNQSSSMDGACSTQWSRVNDERKRANRAAHEASQENRENTMAWTREIETGDSGGVVDFDGVADVLGA